MKDIYVVKNRNILSCRRSEDFRFHNRDVDEVELSIIKSFSKHSDKEKAIAELADKYECDKEDARSSVGEMSQDIFGDSVLLDNDTDIKFWDRTSISPLHIVTELTNRCNLNCIYCYGDFGRNDNSHELGVDEWKKIFSNMLDTGFAGEPVQLLNISGGEPSFYKGVSEILDFSSGKFGTAFFTNCYSISGSIFESLEKHRSLVRINTSFDSCIKEIDESLRGDGFERRLENLRKLDNLGVEVMVNVGINTWNIGYLLKTVEFFFSNFKNIKLRLFPIEKNGRATFLSDDFFVTSNQYMEIIAEMPKFFPELMRNIIHEPIVSEDNNEGTHMCNLGMGIVTLTSEGVTKPCTRSLSFFREIGAENLCIKMSELDSGNILEEVMEKTQEDIDLRHATRGCVLPYILESS
jgi:MoaA/NifB/PqqE/SkfB family radical SAM enzyme